MKDILSKPLAGHACSQSARPTRQQGVSVHEPAQTSGAYDEAVIGAAAKEQPGAAAAATTPFPIPKDAIKQILDHVAFPIQSVTITHAKDQIEAAVNTIVGLQSVAGARDYSGECSVQTLIPLAGGGFVRVGATDDDVAPVPHVIWMDRYAGLPVVGGTDLQTGETFGAKSPNDRETEHPIPTDALKRILDGVTFPIESIQIYHAPAHADAAYDTIRSLRELDGAMDYSGECSLQTLVPLSGGGSVRVGKTDNDVGEPHCLWMDRYEGLNVVGGISLQTGKQF